MLGISGSSDGFYLRFEPRIPSLTVVFEELAKQLTLIILARKRIFVKMFY